MRVTTTCRDSFGSVTTFTISQSHLLPRGPEQFTQRGRLRAGGRRSEVVGRALRALGTTWRSWSWSGTGWTRCVRHWSCENPLWLDSRLVMEPLQAAREGRRGGPMVATHCLPAGPCPRSSEVPRTPHVTSRAAPGPEPSLRYPEVLGADHLGVVHDFALVGGDRREASTSSTRAGWWQRRAGVLWNFHCRM